MATLSTQNKPTSSKNEVMSSYLTAEELKAKLFDRFQKQGVLHGLKAQLRNQLAQELSKAHSPHLSSNQYQNQKDSLKAKNLPLLISTWLVQDYLQRQNYHYTLSTLMTESRQVTSARNDLTIYDILYILGIGQESIQFKIITEKYFMSDLDFLHGFLTTCLRYSKNNVYNMGTQTDMELNSGKPLMRTSEDIHVNLPITQSSALQVSEKHYMSSPPDSDINNKLGYYERIKKNFEKNSLGQKHIEKQEKDIIGMRLKLLKDIDDFYEHEKKVRHELDQRKNALTLKEEYLQFQRNELEKKEQELSRKVGDLDTIMENRFSSFEQQESLKYDEKLQQLQKWEENLKNEEERNKELKELHEKEVAEVNKYKSMLNNLEKENAKLNEQLELMADYHELKNNLARNTAELESLKNEMRTTKSEYEAEKKVMEDRSQESQPGSEKSRSKVVLQELRKLQDDYALDGAVLQQKQQRLEEELQETKQLYISILKEAEKQQLDIQELHKEIHRLQLVKSQNPLEYKLKAQSEKNPTGLIFKSPIIHYWKPGSNGESFINPSLDISKDPNDVTLDIPHIYSEVNVIGKDSQKFILEAKQRINYLQEEADALQSRYSEYLKSWSNANSKIISHPVTFNSSLKSLTNTLHAQVEYKNITHPSPVLHQVKGTKMNLRYSPSYIKSDQRMHHESSVENPINWIYDDNVKKAISTTFSKPPSKMEMSNTRVNVHTNACNENDLIFNSGSPKVNSQTLITGTNRISSFASNSEAVLKEPNLFVEHEIPSTKAHRFDLDAKWKQYSLRSGNQLHISSDDGSQSLEETNDSREKGLQPLNAEDNQPKTIGTLNTSLSDHNKTSPNARKNILPLLQKKSGLNGLEDEGQVHTRKMKYGQSFLGPLPSASIIITKPTVTKDVSLKSQENSQVEIRNNDVDRITEIMVQQTSVEDIPHSTGYTKTASRNGSVQIKDDSMAISLAASHRADGNGNSSKASKMHGQKDEILQLSNVQSELSQINSSNSDIEAELGNIASKVSNNQKPIESDNNFSDNLSHTTVDGTSSSLPSSAKSSSLHREENYLNEKREPLQLELNRKDKISQDIPKNSGNTDENQESKDKLQEPSLSANIDLRENEQVYSPNQMFRAEITQDSGFYKVPADHSHLQNATAQEEMKSNEKSDETLSELHISGASEMDESEDSGW